MNIKLLPLILWCLRRDFDRSPSLYMVWPRLPRDVSHSHTQPLSCACIVSAEEKMELLLRKANLGLSSFTEASFYAKTSLLWFLCNIR